MKGLTELVQPGLPSDWSVLLAGHSAAVSDFLEVARRFPSEAWTRPLAPGKWSPAEITDHVAQTYVVLRGELGGGAGMRLRSSRWRRWVFRHTILPGLLRGGRFPAGVPAPREIRPRESQAEPAQAFAALATQADSFAQELTARAADRGLRLSHAYFGPISAAESLRLVAAHTRHHARQLAAAAP